MKITLSIIVDTLFSAFIAFVLSFIVLFYFMPRTFAIAYAVLLALLFSLVVFKYLFDKKSKVNSNKKSIRLFENAIIQLNLYSKEEQILVLSKLLNKLDHKFTKTKDFLILENKSVAIFPLFSFDKITKTHIVKVFNSVNANFVSYILSAEYSQEIIDFANRFNGKIQLVDGKAFFSALFAHDILPKEKINFAPNQKLSLKSFLNLFDKRQKNKLFLIGLAFMIMSFFAPFKLYYLICGSIFLILSLFCRLFGKEKTATT